MPPITWRNVDAPSLGDPTRTLALAQGSFNSVFDALARPLQQAQATNEANWNNTKANNTNQVLNLLSGFKTVEDAQAAEKAGTVQKMLDQMGAQVDASQVRTAQRNLVPELQQRFTQDVAYKNAKATESEANLVGALNLLQANPKDRKNIAGAADAYVQAGMLRPETAAAILEKTRQLDRADEEFGLRADANRLQREHLALQRKEAQDRREQMRLSEAQRALSMAAAEPSGQLAAVSAALKNSRFTGTPLNTGDAQDLLSKTLRETGISMGNAMTDPENFWNAVKALDSKGPVKYRTLSPDGASIRVNVVDDKGKPIYEKNGQAREMVVPLTAEMVREAIYREKGSDWSDPSVHGVLKSLRRLAQDPLIQRDYLQYQQNMQLRNELEDKLNQINRAGAGIGINYLNGAPPKK